MLPFAKRLAPIKLQSRFARRVGQRFHPAMIKKSVAVEDDLADSLAETALGDSLADYLGRLHVALALEPFAQLRGERRSGRERLPRIVGHYLRVNMVERAVHRKPGPLVAAAHAPPHALAPFHPFCKSLRSHRDPLPRR
jgi:hypothetical protein